MKTDKTLTLSSKYREDRMIVLSTGHLTSEDDDLLRRMAKDTTRNHPFIEVFNYEFGHVLWLDDGVDVDEPDKRYSAFSTTFRHMLACLPEGIRWVRFDADADPVSVFPVFNW